MKSFAHPAEQYSALVVEDESAIAQQLVDGLTLSGFSVRAALSSADALSALEADADIAVVLTDIRMPGLDGLGLAHRVMQQRDDESAVEFVVMTGHATVEDAAAAIRSRASDFLQKPFRLAEAIRAVGAALERAAARRRSAAERTGQLSTRTRATSSIPHDAPMLMKPSEVDRDMQAISHALRTPLTAVAGGAELLSTRPQAAVSAEYLTMLTNGVRETREAIELVEELHLAGRATSVERRPVNLRSLIDRVVADHKFAAEDRGITLEVQLASSITVATSAVEYRRALDHCVAEALNWAKPGGVVRLSLRPEDGVAGCTWLSLTILVVAHGDVSHVPPSGIAFDDGNSALSRTQEGIRFAIARRLVAHLGGRLTSWNGENSTMAVRLSIPL